MCRTRAIYGNSKGFLSLWIAGFLSLQTMLVRAADEAGQWWAFPHGDLYPQAIADPHRVNFGLIGMSMLGEHLPNSGVHRLELKTGGRLGVVGYQPTNGWPWQFSIEGGWDAQFDIDYDHDNIGWDGNLGFLATTLPSHNMALKFGLQHVSSHAGDEYMERTGWQRIGYTRHEIVAGLSMKWADFWRTYGEVGWGYYFSRPELMERGRLQLGLEYERPTTMWGGRLRWYTALDTSAMQERDWRVDGAVQAGLAVAAQERVWRFGVSYYDGRPTMAEFFQETERSIALGLWVDI